MGYQRCCSSCPYGDSPDPLSDFCDGCQAEPVTGFGGSIDNSVIDTDTGEHPWYFSKKDRVWDITCF